MMTRLKLKYVHEFRDRYGKVRRYFRRRGGRAILLPGLPGSIEFMSAYQAALAVVSPPPPSPKHVISGSLSAVAAGYLQSADFANLSPSSQRTYQTVLKPILAAHGHRLTRDLNKMAARHVVESIGARRPGMGNLTCAVLSKVVAYAVEIGLRPDNPFEGLKRYRLGTHHTWTDEEVAQFERRWPLGTRERLAFALLLYTGQRGGDVVKMQRTDVVDGRMIRVAQDKARKGTVNELLIPIHPALARALKAGPVVGLKHLITNTRGQPMQRLTLLIAKAAKTAGLLPRCKAHGLRKAALRRLAEAGSAQSKLPRSAGTARCRRSSATLRRRIRPSSHNPRSPSCRMMTTRAPKVRTVFAAVTQTFAQFATFPGHPRLSV